MRTKCYRNYLFIVIAGLFFSTESPAPIEILGGGDAVNCHSESGSALAGYYFLDYLVDYQSDLQRGLLSGESATDAILATLQRNQATVLADSFAAFLTSARRQLREGPDFSANDVWIADSLEDLRDENLYERVPTNCKDAHTSTHDVALRQAVVRTQRADGVIFKYDREVMRDFSEKPLQLSFLLVHEWLWSHVERSDYIRDINQFLHKEVTHSLPSGVFMQRLTRLGVNDGQFDWLRHMTETALAQSNRRMQNLEVCQFASTADIGIRDWLIQNRATLARRLSGTVLWMGGDDSSSPCVSWSNDRIGPTLYTNSCYEAFTDIDRAKHLLASSLAQFLGSTRAAADQTADVLWNHVGESRTCH